MSAVVIGVMVVSVEGSYSCSSRTEYGLRMGTGVWERMTDMTVCVLLELVCRIRVVECVVDDDDESGGEEKRESVGQWYLYLAWSPVVTLPAHAPWPLWTFVPLSAAQSQARALLRRSSASADLFDLRGC